MIRFAKRCWREDSGFSLVELSVALILSGVVVGTLVTLFAAFSQNVGDASGRAELQGLARGLVGDMVVELRQATQADPNAGAVVRLSPDLIDFYTVPVGGSEPVRVIYERLDCVSGTCDLWVRRYSVESFTNGRYVFRAAPFQQTLLLAGVLADEPLFHGIAWQGNPSTRTTVTSCGGESPCNFPLVGVTLRAQPNSTTRGSAIPLEVREEVRMRNA